MGKKKNEKAQAPSAPAAPFHNPFAALGGMREQLPDAPEPEEAVAAASEAPAAEGKTRFVGNLIVRHERKGRGGKTVTLLLGLRADEALRAELARELGKALGSSARVEGEQLVVGGDQRTRLHAWLLERGAKVRLG